MSILRKELLGAVGLAWIILAMLACSSNQKASGGAHGTDGASAQEQDAGGSTPVGNARQFTVAGISNATAIGAGWGHACAVLDDGSVRCWGVNDSGQLGDGTANNSQTPVVVSNLSGAIAIAAGAKHTCVVVSDGTVQCWGHNSEGQLGVDDRTVNQLSPVSVRGLSGAVSITAGVFHTCVLVSGGELRCWGGNIDGELGNDVSVVRSTTPVAVSSVSGAIVVAAGRVHTCAAISNGTVQCWGGNDGGQLGNGLSDNGMSRWSPTPAEVGGITGATDIAAGSSHTCALVANGEVQCWGTNRNGQLGSGSTVDSFTPVGVVGLSGAVTIEAGDSETCALLSDGTVTCWGHYFQTSGGGTTTGSLTPVSVDGISGAIGLTMGLATDYGCVVMADKTVRCFGGYTW